MEEIQKQAADSRILEFNLTTTLTNLETVIGGVLGLAVIDNPHFDPINPDHLTYIRLNSATASLIPLYPGMILRAAIEKFYITNTVAMSGNAQRRLLRLMSLPFDTCNIDGLEPNRADQFLAFEFQEQAVGPGGGRFEIDLPTYGYKYLEFNFQDDVAVVKEKLIGIGTIKYIDAARTLGSYTSHWTASRAFRRVTKTIPLHGEDRFQVAILNFSTAQTLDADINLMLHN